MTAFPGKPLNTDGNGIHTAFEYLTDRWIAWYRSTDLGDVTDAAAVDHTSDSSVVSLLKGLLKATGTAEEGLLKAEDTPASSGDAGVSVLAVRRDTPGTGIGIDGDYTTLATDATGNLRTITVLEETSRENSTSVALESNRIVKATEGVFYGFQGHVSGTSPSSGFIQVFDAATATGTPEFSIPISPGDSFSWEVSGGRSHTTGIVIAFSTTEATFTTGGSYIWVDAQYV